MLSPRWTVNAEVSGIWFQEDEYDDGAGPWSGPDSLVDAARAWRTWSGMDPAERQEAVGDWLRARADTEGTRTRFGTETRVNLAAVYRAYTDLDRGLRVDAVLEAQYLGLGRDRTDGVYERATGGDMIYLMPGVRAYWENLSVAFGVKTPVWTDLNEEDEQQGGEGTEDYRLIFAVSALF
jgi:hypothetical protein